MHEYLEAPDADDVDGAWERPVDQHGQARVVPRELSPHPHGECIMKELGEHPNLIVEVRNDIFEAIR